MNNDIRKLCAWFVSANFSQYQVEDLLEIISRTNPKKIIIEFEKIRKVVETSSDSNFTPSKIQAASKNAFSSTFPSEDTVLRVVDLLKNEAGLSARESFDLLDRTLRDNYPNRHYPMPNPKAGITAWIRALTHDFTDSELLHIASRLRNQIVHGSEKLDDWRLKE